MAQGLSWEQFMSIKSSIRQYGWLLADLYHMQRGWVQGTLSLLDTLLAEREVQGEILEIGCGNGIVLRDLSQRFPACGLHGIDLNTQALSHARQRIAQTLSLAQADLSQLPFANERFSLIVALDVFDQKGVDLVQGLREAYRILQPQGRILLRVSAHPWLYGPHDIAFNTGQRMQRGELLQLLGQLGFVPVRVTYANSLLAGPVMVLRLLQRWGWMPFDATLYRSSFIDGLIEAALHLEALWLRWAALPFGLSLMLIAQKEGK
jgi:SAM-dependent methyltransferase